MLRQFEQGGLSQQRVCIEIAETAAIGGDMTSALKVTNALKAAGIKFSLDDFGIGMPWFRRMKTLPADFVRSRLLHQNLSNVKWISP